MTTLYYDVRSEYRYDPTDRAEKTVRGKVVVRDPNAIDAIGLHQTAVTFGVSASQIRAAGGDPRLAQFMRAKRVNAHSTVFDEGAFVLAYPLRNHVNHGNGMNPRTLALEVEGLYNGKPGGTRGEPKQRTIDAMIFGIDKLVEEGAKEGITIRHLLAHRQFSWSRQSDPGWALWGPAREHCEAKGITTLPTLVDGSGRPIPKVWDPRQSATY